MRALGLFVLIWESISVIAALGGVSFGHDGSPRLMAICGSLMMPFAFYVTWKLDLLLEPKGATDVPETAIFQGKPRSVG